MQIPFNNFSRLMMWALGVFVFSTTALAIWATIADPPVWGRLMVYPKPIDHLSFWPYTASLIVLLIRGAFHCRAGYVPRHAMMVGLGMWAIFIIGEELRWGLRPLLEWAMPEIMADTVYNRPVSVQDWMIFALTPLPARVGQVLHAAAILTRIFMPVMLIAGVFALFIKRSRVCAALRAAMPHTAGYAPRFAAAYICAMAGVIGLEIFGLFHPAPTGGVEEVLELNAALIWLALTLSVRIGAQACPAR